MARSKNINKSSRAQVRAKSRPKPLPRNLQNDLRAQARALEKLGLYKLGDTKEITKKRAETIIKRFNEAQKHGVYTGSKTIRPFVKVKNHYELNPRFKKIKTKQKINSPGVLNTPKGAIIPVSTESGKVTKVKGKTIYKKEYLQGAEREVITGHMDAKHTLAFAKNLSDGNFDFPEDYYIRISVWGGDYRAFHSLEALNVYVNKYAEAIARHPKWAKYNPFRIEYVALTAKEKFAKSGIYDAEIPIPKKRKRK